MTNLLRQYKIANEIEISQQEQDEAYELLEELGFIEEDMNFIDDLNYQALKQETDYERIMNAA